MGSGCTRYSLAEGDQWIASQFRQAVDAPEGVALAGPQIPFDPASAKADFIALYCQRTSGLATALAFKRRGMIDQRDFCSVVQRYHRQLLLFRRPLQRVSNAFIADPVERRSVETISKRLPCRHLPQAFPCLCVDNVAQLTQLGCIEDPRIDFVETGEGLGPENVSFRRPQACQYSLRLFHRRVDQFCGRGAVRPSAIDSASSIADWSNGAVDRISTAIAN